TTLYWLENAGEAIIRTTVGSSRLDTIAVAPLPGSSFRRFADFYVDEEAETIYIGVPDGAIYKTDLDGNSPEQLVNISPLAGVLTIEKDIENNLLFIGVGVGPETIITFDLQTKEIDRSTLGGIGFGALFIAIDSNAEAVYFTEEAGARVIRRTSYDGSEVEVFLMREDVVGCVSLDANEEDLYWSEGNHIYKSDLATRQVDIAIEGRDSPGCFAIDTNARKVYWTGVDTIWQSDLDGSSREVIVDGLSIPGRLKVPEVMTRLSKESSLNPSIFTLTSYPNPFSHNTTIRFSLEEPSRVSLNLFNALGQEMRVVVAEEVFLGHQN
ncbi:MAG: hypothetical protein AAGM67_19920, partial [Bacteroidota bacterium]